jgi:hypothetical protein
MAMTSRGDRNSDFKFDENSMIIALIHIKTDMLFTISLEIWYLSHFIRHYFVEKMFSYSSTKSYLVIKIAQKGKLSIEYFYFVTYQTNFFRAIFSFRCNWFDSDKQAHQSSKIHTRRISPPFTSSTIWFFNCVIFSVTFSAFKISLAEGKISINIRYGVLIFFL